MSSTVIKLFQQQLYLLSLSWDSLYSVTRDEVIKTIKKLLLSMTIQSVEHNVLVPSSLLICFHLGNFPITAHILLFFIIAMLLSECIVMPGHLEFCKRGILEAILCWGIQQWHKYCRHPVLPGLWI